MAPKLRDGLLGCMRHGLGCFDVVGRSSGDIVGSRPQNFLRIFRKRRDSTRVDEAPLMDAGRILWRVGFYLPSTSCRFTIGESLL